MTRDPIGSLATIPIAATTRSPVAADPITAELTRVGGRVFWWGWAGQTAIIAGVNVLDVLTRLHDTQAHNLAEPAWRAILYEASSGLVMSLLYPAVWWLAHRFRLGDLRRLRGIAALVAGALGFAVVHVGGFVLVRKLVCAMVGEGYTFGGLGPFFYELPKDLVSYALMVGLVRGAVRLFEGLPRPAPRATPEASTFDIRDGAKVVRVRIDDILAVRSAGNYVEFLLADGRAPLMRGTLAGVEAQLRPHGVARTHRSWLVNTGSIEVIDPAGSGDFRLSLRGGIEAPLSRRFRPGLREG
jgi:hypothetical protein